MCLTIVESEIYLRRISISDTHLAVVERESAICRDVHREGTCSRIDDVESHRGVLGAETEVDGLDVLVLIKGINIRCFRVDVEACHGVDLHIATGPEAETVFAGFGIRDCERLIHRVELRGEVCHLLPPVFTVYGTFHDKGGIVVTHEGTQTAITAFTFLSRKR